MRGKIAWLGLVLAMVTMILALPLRAAETSQTIAFQGCDGTLTGTVDLRLRLFNAATGGIMVFEETQTGIAVDTANCVSVRIGNATPLMTSLFTTNPSLWATFALDATPDTELGGGRVPITANGYAFRATNADNAQTLVPGATVSGDSTTALLAITNTNPAGKGLAATGNQAGLYGESLQPTVGIGVQGKGAIAISGQSDDSNGRGVVGTSTDSAGVTYGVAGQISSTNSSAAGVLGVSNALTGGASGVWGQTNSSSTNATGVFGVANAISGATVGVWGRTLSNSDGAAGVFGDMTTTTGNSAGVWGRTRSVTGGAAGVFGESLGTNGRTFGVYGATTTDGTGAGVLGYSSGTNGNGVIGEANTGSAAYGIWGKSTSGFAGFFDGKVRVNGNMEARVVQITGGSDLSEKFEVRDTHRAIEPGMVVAIDAENPGKLMVSAQAYNRRVAGVISGAGGVSPGMLMGQVGTLADGDHPVALSGRVYVWADASYGAIVPGDLLTTSNIPGHAMKVANYGKAQGAIIGKAMTGLSNGRGLVLVLVALQ
ncbi:MAG: hypothetical protein HYR55_00555 [Acidobacteria bacterium]|nr:hypothetical protein [Acidobacteriota bacterium]